MGLFISALRIGFRQMLRRPGESATAIVVLALGIGLAATGWAVVWGTYLRQVPVPGGERLVRVAVVDADQPDGLATLGYDAFRALRDDLEELQSLERLEAWIAFGYDVSGLPGPSVRAKGACVTSGVLRLTAGMHFPYRQDLWVPERAEHLDRSWMQVLARLREDTDPAVAVEEIEAALSHLPGSNVARRRVAIEPLRDTYHDDQMRAGVVGNATCSPPDCRSTTTRAMPTRIPDTSCGRRCSAT